VVSWEQAVSRLLWMLRLDSIRRKLLVFALLATLIPSISTAWISYQQNKRSLTEKVTRELQSVSAQTAREMDLWIKERLYELRVFASSYEVSENLDRMARGGRARGEHPRGRLTDYLRSVRDRFADYQELLVVNEDGEDVASTATPPTPSRLPKGWTTTIRAENAIVGDAYWDDALKKGVVVFAVPVYRTGGRLLGAFTAKVDLAAVYRLLRRFTAGDSSRLYLVTADGRALVGSQSGPSEITRRSLDAGTTQRLFDGEGSVVQYAGIDGARVVGALKRVPQVNWGVLAEVPADAAFRQVARLRNVTALMVTALFVGVGLLAYFLGLLITRPLDRLREGAAKVAGGDLAVVLPMVSGGELGYVTEVFNDMAVRLRDSRRELERLSVTDDLTGLYNRRYLMDMLALEIRRSRRMRHPFAVLIADVDNFKPYNDAYGHLEGDAALARIAAILRDTSRDVDCAARYGGEEFVVLMPETEMEGAVDTAQRIRERLADDAAIGEKLTISIGVAQFGADGETPETLLARADAALYQAKRDGRDRVVRSAR